VTVAVCTTALVLFFDSLAAFAFAKYDFPAKRFLFGLLLSMYILPTQLAIIPQYEIMVQLGWLGSLKALIVPAAANAFGIFWMRQYCLSVPDELLDAARVDGAGEFGIFSRIVLPVIRPALASLAIFVFLTSWNDFLAPLVFLRSEEKFTVQLWLSIVSEQQNVSQPAIVMAGSLLASIPIVILFAALQRHFIAGLTAGSVK
jgi:cellobiose transport system permease protein